MDQWSFHFSIALVDGCDESRERLGDSLESFGFRVERFRDADDAFDHARRRFVDGLIVCVPSLARLEDGLVLATMVRFTRSTARIPILLLTRDAVSDTQPARRAGCTRVLILPALAEDIVATLLELLESRAA